MLGEWAVSEAPVSTCRPGTNEPTGLRTRLEGADLSRARLAGRDNSRASLRGPGVMGVSALSAADRSRPSLPGADKSRYPLEEEDLR